MKYPGMTEDSADGLVMALLAKPEAERLSSYRSEHDAEHPVNLHVGGNYPREAVEEASTAAMADWDQRVADPNGKISTGEREQVEARMASVVHAALRDLAPRVLGDMDFWRYLALHPFRWYLLAREPELQAQDYGGTSPHPKKDGVREAKDSRYQLLLRTFLWGKAAYDPTAEDPYERATKVRASNGAEIDVWHSHIVRVQLGQIGEIPHHFIDSICEAPKACDRDNGRLVEKRLTRMKHNILLDVYEGSDARQLVDNQKAAVVGGGPTA